MKKVVVWILLIMLIPTSFALNIPPPPPIGIDVDPTCVDFVKNGDETGADCGGSCVAEGKKCRKNQGCLSNNDCRSDNCLNNKCLEGDSTLSSQRSAVTTKTTALATTKKTQNSISTKKAVVQKSTLTTPNTGSSSPSVSSNTVPQPVSPASAPIQAQPTVTIEQIEAVCAKNIVGQATAPLEVPKKGSGLVLALTALILIETTVLIVKTGKQKFTPLQRYVQRQLHRDVPRAKIYDALQQHGYGHDEIMNALR